ncbi:MAG: Two-component hybrid sensor and regulator [uncultured Sulfurovum sp.]|uniref:Two-component hybrid sensor and regulator n=1 Tax=uncultured Sulfurovum sp. TaxID=269237 RepID=A0A6S6U7S8_9BACT|nr:MAG: Two-component hybrid sensor and regulator [uncultured Sulfurovum sp.]
MKKNKIMVVEDEKITSLFIRETLEEYGYEEIIEYVYGQDLIDVVKSGTVPDLILMDINIKGAKDGIQTAKEVLQFCDVPIIFMSAYNDNETIKEVLNVSLYGFISKPFNERELYIALEIAWKNFYTDISTCKVGDTKKVQLYEDCYYELETKSICLLDVPVSLSHNQQILLDILVKNMNSMVDKNTLSYSIWGIEEESSSSLRTLVYLLRKKLKGIEISSQSKHGYLLKASYL